MAVKDGVGVCTRVAVGIAWNDRISEKRSAKGKDRERGERATGEE